MSYLDSKKKSKKKDTNHVAMDPHAGPQKANPALANKVGANKSTMGRRKGDR